MNSIFKIAGIVLSLIMSQLIGGNIAQAQSINLVAGLPKAPFIIEENGRGLQLDIIRAALFHENIEATFTHVPLARNVTSFQSLNAEGVITLPTDFSYPNIYLSTPYIRYRNVAVSLVESAFDIATVADLSGKSVAAFQNAKKFMGDEYKRTMSYSLDYREVAEQQKQIEMLFLRQSEVIILDQDIFKYFIQVAQDPLYKKEFKVHSIFNERPYSIGFRTEELRDKFNLGLQKIKDQGEYQRIIEKYVE